MLTTGHPVRPASGLVRRWLRLLIFHQKTTNINEVTGRNADTDGYFIEGGQPEKDLRQDANRSRPQKRRNCRRPSEVYYTPDVRCVESVRERSKSSVIRINMQGWLRSIVSSADSLVLMLGLGGLAILHLVQFVSGFLPIPSLALDIFASIAYFWFCPVLLVQRLVSLAKGRVVKSWSIVMLFV